MSDIELSFENGFSPVDELDWIDAVTKALKGKPPSHLDRKTLDGVSLKALYRESDWPSGRDPLGQPGASPYLRGGAAVRDVYLPWDIRQSFTHPDIMITNQEILKDLECGVSSVELAIDPEGQAGCAINSLADMRGALKNVCGDIAPIALSACGERPYYGLEAAGWLADFAAEAGTMADQALCFNIAPLARLAELGQLDEALGDVFTQTAAHVQDLGRRFPKARLLRIDGRVLHEAGASDSEELGGLIAQAIDTIRRLDAAACAPEKIADRLVFTLATGPDFALGIGKLRAMRRLWAKCLTALDLAPHPAYLQAYSSRRMLTRYDPWVNILRNTAACFAGAIGGADSITVRSFNSLHTVPEKLGRRIARNTQLIAQEESGLGHIADPAGGSWFMENYSDALAKSAWTVFQQIEAEGGFAQSLQDGYLQAKLTLSKKRLKQVAATRKSPITGISLYPLLDEVPAPKRTDIGSRTDFSIEDNPAPIPESAPDAATAVPLQPFLLSEDYEALRRFADHYLSRKGHRPNVFIATLGPPATHGARVNFVRNLLAAGGIEVALAPSPELTSEAMAAAFRASKSGPVAVICGSEAAYADEAVELARALKTAGATRIYLAGRTGDQAQVWAKAGIDSYLYTGMDCIAALQILHAELGVTL